MGRVGIWEGCFFYGDAFESHPPGDFTLEVLDRVESRFRGEARDHDASARVASVKGRCGGGSIRFTKWYEEAIVVDPEGSPATLREALRRQGIRLLAGRAQVVRYQGRWNDAESRFDGEWVCRRKWILTTRGPLVLPVTFGTFWLGPRSSGDRSALL